MQLSRKYIVGNWKMHGDAALARTLADAVTASSGALPPEVEIVLCPPATLLREVSVQITGFNVRVGGQDCHAQPSGAFTGDISAQMLRDAGCGYVIVGHSERRQGHGETSAQVRAKAEAALAAGLIPIICIGETQAERAAGQAEAVVAQQLQESMPTGHFILAYEPVWAIGTGQTATSEDIRRMHAFITERTQGKAPVLYGGSVKAENARDILTIAGVSGVLVGGASLKAEAFCAIIASVR